MEITGTVYKIFETQTISDKFKKREIVIKTEEQYPQLICCELHQEKVELAEQKSVGDAITASINIRGKEFNEKFYNTIIIWKLN